MRAYRWSTYPAYIGQARRQEFVDYEAVLAAVDLAAEAGLAYLSLYTFSTENWARAEAEVSYLMFLVRSYLRKEYDFYREHGIRIVHSGDMERLQPDIARRIVDCRHHLAADRLLCQLP